jgi:hypothetical protein
VKVAPKSFENTFLHITSNFYKSTLLKSRALSLNLYFAPEPASTQPFHSADDAPAPRHSIHAPVIACAKPRSAAGSSFSARRSVAVQAEFESKGFETSFSFDGFNG